MPPAFPDRSASHASPVSRPYNPGRPLRPPVWAPPRSLAATWGIIVIFSSCGYLDVSVPRVCPHFVGDARLRAPGCPIRKSTDQRLFASPRGLSQLITSFIAAKSQGIPCAPLVTYSILYSFFFFSLSGLTPPGVRPYSLSPSSLSKNVGRAFAAPVEDNGFEPMTPCVQGRCSSQLS